MSNLKAFLAQNVERADEIEVVVSHRMKDESGPVKWRLRPITTDQDEMIRKSCTKKVPVPGKKGMMTNETDHAKYIGKLAAACVVYPNLNDAELQNSYNVMGDDVLLKTMLLPGEYADLIKKVEEVNGYELTQDDLVEEAKN